MASFPRDRRPTSRCSGRSAEDGRPPLNGKAFDRRGHDDLDSMVSHCCFCRRRADGGRGQCHRPNSCAEARSERLRCASPGRLVRTRCVPRMSGCRLWEVDTCRGSAGPQRLPPRQAGPPNRRRPRAKAGMNPSDGAVAVEQAVAADYPAAGTSCRIEAPTRRRACS